ncbi:MAG: NAD-dependent epimerase/dehydratase family protein [Dehalococcoidia bacterium]
MIDATTIASEYRGLPVLVTGGLGFIGSNLVIRLVGLGARVTVLDSLNEGQGGNLANIEPVKDEIALTIADQADRSVVDELVRGAAVVFNLAGRGAHMDSVRDPLGDLHANATAQLVLLDACRARNPETKVVFAGTRSQYGRTEALPVNEGHPQVPTDINGANKIAAERYHLVYQAMHGLRACSLRLTNTYGPRQLMAHGRQGFMNWFTRLAMDGGEITVYGDGAQLRDLSYVDDTVDAFLYAGIDPAADGEAFNVGSGMPMSVRRIAELVVAAAGRGRVRMVEYPPDQRPIEVGDFVADITKIRSTLGWSPSIPLEEGIARTVAYFEPRRNLYWDATT